MTPTNKAAHHNRQAASHARLKHTKTRAQKPLYTAAKGDSRTLMPRQDTRVQAGRERTHVSRICAGVVC